MNEDQLKKAWILCEKANKVFGFTGKCNEFDSYVYLVILPKEHYFQAWLSIKGVKTDQYEDFDYFWSKNFYKGTDIDKALDHLDQWLNEFSANKARNERVMDLVSSMSGRKLSYQRVENFIAEFNKIIAGAK
jgi:hypothetical protein